MNALLVVLAKELRNHFRDPRALASALLFPLLAAGLVALMLSLMVSWYRDDAALRIAIDGGERAPNLIAFLMRHGVAIEKAPEQPAREVQVQDGRQDIIIAVPKEYPEAIRSGRSAPLELYFDQSRNRARSAVQRTRALLEIYGQQLGRMRLLARGVNPELVDPLAIEEVNVASAQSTAANVVGMVPLFLLMAAFIGGMSVAVDAIAGERERGELESLLLNPASRGSLAAGKWAASFAVAVGTLLLTLMALAAVLRGIPLAEIGLRVAVGPRELATLLAILLPLCAAICALQLALATYARSVKEAQAYLSVLMMVPMIPGIFLSLSPLKISPWMSWAPILGQEVLLNGVFRGETIPLGSLFAAAAMAAGVAASALGVTATLLRRESIVWGR